MENLFHGSNAKSPSCFYPIPQAAECIARIVERSNGAVIYLSTDAAESETSLLQSLVVVDGKIVPLVKRPPRNSAEKWDALLYRHGIEDDSQVRILLLLFLEPFYTFVYKPKHRISWKHVYFSLVLCGLHLIAL